MEKISRTKVETLIKSTNGRIFSAKFLKKDKSSRLMNARLGVHKNLKGGVNKTVKASNAYMTVFDIKADDYRTLNLDTVQELHIDGHVYQVV